MPILRLVALFFLATGMIGGWVTGTWVQHELLLFQQLWDCLRPGQLLLGDRGFGSWGLLTQYQARCIHAVFHLRGARRRDFRRGRSLGRDQRLVHWNKPPSRPRTISAAEWATLPACLELRLVHCRLRIRGFRTTQIALVTTLLDTQRYPLEAFGLLYLRRWHMELAFRDLKITLQMDQLSCKTTDNLAREIRLHLLVHNLTRRESVIESRVVPFDKATAVWAAELFNKTGRRRGSRSDCLIAATAILSQAQVATVNESDFRTFVPHGLKLAIAPPPPASPSAPQTSTGNN